MKNEFLTQDEKEFLKENIEFLIEIFKETHEDLVIDLNHEAFEGWNYFDDKYSRSLFFCEADRTYMYGYCFIFARIIKSIFPEASFVFQKYPDTTDLASHVLIKLADLVFDVEGIKTDKYNSQNKIYLSDRCTKDLCGIYKDDSSLLISYAENNFKNMNEDLYERLRSGFLKKLKDNLCFVNDSFSC